MKHAILIDASTFLFRSYHVNSDKLTRPSDGEPIGAVFGVVQSLWKLTTKPPRLITRSGPTFPTHAIALFDSPGLTHRHMIDATYKAHRGAHPEKLDRQRPMVKEAFEAFGIATERKDGFEADDLIATYARMGEDQGAEVTIISPDKDLMQLIGPSIRLWDKGKFIQSDDVKERFGILPHQLLDYLSLVGDQADGIAGAPGIGPVKARKMINAGSYPTILQAERAKALIKLLEDVEVDKSFDDLEWSPDYLEIYDFCMRMEFEGVARWVEKAMAQETQSEATDAPPEQ